jgi:RHS repeat-associated protein
MAGATDPNKAITIEYGTGADAQRIAAIYAPAEQGGSVPTVRYDYDAAGNLWKVRKLVDKTLAAADPNTGYEVLTYEYDNTQFDPADHYITAIKDPRGLQPIQYLYDDAGRLVGTKDAKGNTIAIEHDITGRQEIVTDRAGNPTIYEYDNRGNVLSVTDCQGHSTVYTYSDPNNPGRQTSVTQQVPDPDDPNDLVPAVTQYSYNNHTDPETNVLIKGKVAVETIVDPVGNLTQTHYDTIGNVTTTISGKDGQLSPSVSYTPVTKTENTYADNRLVETKTFGPGADNQFETIDDVLTSHSTTTYDSETKLLTQTTQIDPLGILPDVTTTYTYDPASGSPDQPYAVSDTQGFAQYFQYDQNNQQTSSWYEWENPSDGDTAIDFYVYSVNVYDDAGRIIRSEQMIDDATLGEPYFNARTLSQTVYNSIGKVDYTLDENGLLTKYLYDQTGNTVETLVYSSLSAYNANFANYLGSGSAAGIMTISRTLYDAEGRAIVSVGPYDPADMANHQPVGTETVYDTLGRVERTRRWADVAITLENVVVDGVIVGREATGWTTNGAAPIPDHELSYARTVYDLAGRVWKTYSQNEDGDEIFTAEYEYDIAGRQIAVISLPGTADETVTETHYDGSRRDYVIDGRQNTTSFVFDAVGRLITTALPNVGYVYWDASSVLQNTSTAVYQHAGYNGMGQKTRDSAVTAQSDPGHTDNLSDLMHLRLRPKTFGYDTAGRMNDVVLPQLSGGENPEYQYIHDLYGNQVGILDSELRLTVFGYDHLNRQRVKYMPFEVATVPASAADVYAVLSAVNPAPAAETWDYDTFGRLERHTEYKKQDTGYVYNTLGQLWQKKIYAFADTNPADGQNDNYPDVPAQVLEYAYDNLGRQTAVFRDTILVEAFEYDAQGNVVRIESPEGIINYDYSPITGRKVRTWTGDTFQTAVSVTEYAYDNIGRLASVSVVKRDSQTLSTPEITQYKYDANGNRRAVTLANGIYTEYTYDALNRLTNITHYTNDSKTNEISHFGYQLYADGMRATVDESMSEQRDVTYRYDALNRLIQEDSYTTSSPHYGYTANYTYDLAGNRLSRTVEVTNSGGTYTLQTISTYDPDTDRLLTETNTEPIAAIPYGDMQHIYAYAGPDGGIAYQLPDSAARIGQFRAFFLGLPSVVNTVLFYGIMILVPVAFFWPILWKALQWFVRHNLGEKSSQRPALSLWHRMLCVLLSYIFLIGPEVFYNFAQAEIQYSQLSTTAWGIDGEVFSYVYDANGSQVYKVYVAVPNIESMTPAGMATWLSNNPTVDYEHSDYNLQNRLSTLTKVRHGADTTETVVDYIYDPSGNRTSAETTVTVDSTVEEHMLTNYLVDPSNHTGYAQVMEETTVNQLDTTDAKRIQYTLGDDVISQTKSTWNNGTSTWVVADTQYLLYDGHGSTRQLARPDKSVIESYSYDGYGVMLGDAANAQTNLLYSGEQYDKNLSQYYLRARYYNPLNGLFNQMDPYAGNTSDPQSLHKYLYCHNNPVNGIDPSGMNYTFVSTLATFCIMTILMSANWVVAPTENRDYSEYSDTTGDIAAGAVFTVALVGTIALAAKLLVIPIATKIAKYFSNTGLRKAATVSQEKAQEYLINKLNTSVDEAKSFVDAFDGNITVEIVEKGETFLRYTDKPTSKGRWLTDRLFKTPEEAVKALHLEPYGNNAMLVQTVRSTGRSLVFRGAIKNGAKGVEQVFILSEDPIFEFTMGMSY